MPEARAGHGITILLFLFAAFLLVQPLVYTESLRDITSLPRWTLLVLFVPGLLIAILVQNFRHGIPLYTHRIFAFSLLLLIWAACSYFWSFDPNATLYTSLKLLALILLGFSAMQVSVTTRRVLILITASVTGAAIVSLIGLLQILGFTPFDFTQYAPPASTFGNKNFSAMFLDLATPLAFVLIFIARQIRDIWLAALLFGLCFAYWVLIHSRASWLALIMVFLVLLFVLYRNAEFRQQFLSLGKTRIVPITMALLLPVLIYMLSSELEQLTSKRQISTLDIGMEIRLRAYANAIPMIKDNPLSGFGLGSFMLAFRPYMFSVVPLLTMSENMYMLHLHNEFLQIVIELGLPGLILAMAIFYLALANTFRLVTMHSELPLRLIALGCLLALSAFAVHALLSFPLRLPSSSILLWLIFGCIAGMSGTLKPLKTIRLKSGFVTTTISLSLICILIGNGTYFHKLLENSMQVKALELAIKEDECERILPIAVQIDPTLNYDAMLLTPFAFLKCGANYQTSIQPLNKILDYAPNNTISRLKRGYLYLENNQPNLAIRDFVVIAKILPNRSSGYRGIADAAATMGNFPLAKEMYRKSLKIEPENPSAIEMLEKLEKLSPK